MKLVEMATSLDLTVRQISIKDELNKFWVNTGEIEPTFFRGYRRDLRRAFSFLSNEYDRPRTQIERVCVHIGAPFLYGLPGVIEIGRAKQFLIEHADNNSDSLRILENRFFDIGTADTTRYQGRLIVDDKSQVSNLAETLGLKAGIVYQMAFVYSLLHTMLPIPIYNELGKLFKRFCQAVRQWGYQAEKIRQECRRTNKEYRLPLEDILPPETYEIRAAKKGHDGN
jgi:hypothetical protein